MHANRPEFYRGSIGYSSIALPESRSGYQTPGLSFINPQGHLQVAAMEVLYTELNLLDLNRSLGGIASIVDKIEVL
mgnify:CR=1 FL=1